MGARVPLGRGQLPGGHRCRDGRDGTLVLADRAEHDARFSRPHVRSWRLSVRAVLLRSSRGHPSGADLLRRGGPALAMGRPTERDGSAPATDERVKSNFAPFPDAPLFPICDPIQVRDPDTVPNQVRHSAAANGCRRRSCRRDLIVFGAGRELSPLRRAKTDSRRVGSLRGRRRAVSSRADRRRGSSRTFAARAPTSGDNARRATAS